MERGHHGRGTWQRDQHKQGNDGQGGGGIGIGSGGGGSEAALVDHVHPKIAAMMKPVWEVHGKKIGISALCNGAGIMNRELPYLKNMIDEKGNNKMCYTHLCGECRWGQKCHFIHVHGRDLSDPFVEEFTKKLTPGAAFMKTQPSLKKRPAPGGGRGGDGGKGGIKILFLSLLDLFSS